MTLLSDSSIVVVWEDQDYITEIPFSSYPIIKRTILYKEKLYVGSGDLVADDTQDGSLLHPYSNFYQVFEGVYTGE